MRQAFAKGESEIVLIQLTVKQHRQQVERGAVLIYARLLQRQKVIFVVVDEVPEAGVQTEKRCIVRG